MASRLRLAPTLPSEVKVWGQSTVLPWYSKAQVPDFHLRPYGSHPMANRMAHIELWEGPRGDIGGRSVPCGVIRSPMPRHLTYQSTNQLNHNIQ